MIMVSKQFTTGLVVGVMIATSLTNLMSITMPSALSFDDELRAGASTTGTTGASTTTTTTTVPPLERIRLPIAKPPSINHGCHVEFIDPNMTICHLIPFGYNFGDMVGPAVIQRLLALAFDGCSTDQIPVMDMSFQHKKPRRKGQVCLFSVGSVFPQVRSHDHVWGTGTYGNHLTCQEQPSTNITMYATRGPNSAKNVLEKCGANNINTPLQIENGFGFETVGDPAVLVPYIFPEFYDGTDRSIANQTCVMPHYFDQNFETNLIQEQGWTKFSVNDEWMSVVRGLAGCARIMASSLHGVIFATAYGIPHRWYQNHKYLREFKFHDFFDSWLPHHPQMKQQKVKTITQLIQENAWVTPPPADARLAYANRILATFPFHLFRVVSISFVSRRS